MKPAKGWAIVGFAALLVVSYFAWDLYFSPEARVRRTLDGAAEAAEAADAEGFLSYLSPDYHDFLHAERSLINDRVQEAFSRIDRMNVTLQNVEVVVEGRVATASFDLVVVAVRGEERYVVLGTPFDPEKVTAQLERGSDGFKVTSVERRAAVATPEPLR